MQKPNQPHPSVVVLVLYIAKPPQTVVVFGPNPSLVERHGSAVSSKPIGASYEAIPWSLETLVDTPRELTL